MTTTITKKVTISEEELRYALWGFLKKKLGDNLTNKPSGNKITNVRFFNGDQIVEPLYTNIQIEWEDDV